MSESMVDEAKEEEAKQEDAKEEKDTDLTVSAPSVDSWQEDESLSTSENAIGAVISTPTAKPFVTVDRKNELLLQARASRLAWIQSVPLPYSTKFDSPAKGSHQHLSVLKSTHAVHKIPSIEGVLCSLYGIDESHRTASEVAERVHSLLDSIESKQSDRDLAILTGSQFMDEQLSASNITQRQIDLLKAYRGFVTKLETPACASLVQGMRNFIFKLSYSTASELASSLRTYVDNTFEAIKAHPAWKEDGAGDSVRHALESFLCGQCHNNIQSTLEDQVDKETEFYERLISLQFLNPAHLDIHCISDSESVDELLLEPTTALGWLDAYFSPFEKLQCILRTYHGVNAALKEALNCNTNSDKLPSADEVLPALILTVIRAKPPRLLSNLEMIETYCSSEYLRGEAGYAYTNLYGAVQFLRELKLDEPDTLSISAIEFRKGLEVCRAAAETQLKSAVESDKSAGKVSKPALSQIPLDVPVTVVRAARLQGEAVDIDWALRWQAEHPASSELSPTGESSGPENSSLPSGFSRSYSFLTSRPEDIRVSDLPQLLAEYRMLVHTTEQLLAEQTTRTAKERKERVSKERKALIERAIEIDPSLLRRAKNKRK